MLTGGLLIPYVTGEHGRGVFGPGGSDSPKLLLIEDDGIVRAWVRLALRDGEWTIAAEAGSAEAQRRA